MKKDICNGQNKSRNVIVTLVNKSEKVIDLAKKYSCHTV